MRVISMIIAACALAACASTPGGSASRVRNVITIDEIRTTTHANAYEIVQQLRPEFLRTRGATSINDTRPEQAVVYIDGLRAGGLDSLRSVSRDVLYEIRFLNGTDATTLYGTGHGGGAIQILTRRG